jgi:hypothetical protein
MAIIQRAPGDKPGEDIVSEVLVSEAAKIERGRNEINYSSTDMILKTGAVVSSQFIAPGSLIEIQDRTGNSRGMLTSYSVSIQGVAVSTNITIECVK